MVNVKIRHKKIGDGNPCYISLEAGATWLDYHNAREMIKAASASGADAVKFQTFLPGDSERMIYNQNLKVEFTTTKGKKTESIFDALKRRELPKNKWKELVNYSHKHNLAFITTSVFPETVDFIKKIGVDAIKIAKGDINNVLLIDYASKQKIPIILDGREKFSDVEKAIKISKKNKNHQIIIMHCPSGYPAKNSGIHLKTIPEIKKKYHLPVGFSDHSPDDTMNYAALALGANMLEKTITSNKKQQHVEHFMSLELNELNSFVTKIRNVELAMGDPKILKISRVTEDVRRSFVTKKFIHKNEKIKSEHLDFKRPGNLGISVSKGIDLLNKTAKIDIPKGTILQNNMLK